MSLSSVLSALGLAPKTLTEARGTLDTSKATLESVAALFTTAGLNLEAFLGAGPESLKAHLASIDNAAQVAALSLELATAKSALETKAGEVASLEASLAARTAVLSTLGIAEMQTADTPEAIKSAFAAHVAKQTTLALAKTGHPPVHQIDANAGPAAEQLSDEAHLAAYEKLEGADAKAYLSTHSQALWRADISRRTSRR
jgi:hypothetical protein